MGLPSVEELSNILIKAGAKRIVKDLVRDLCHHSNKQQIMISADSNDFCLEFSEIAATILLLHEQIRYRETSRGRGKSGQVEPLDDANAMLLFTYTSEYSCAQT